MAENLQSSTTNDEEEDNPMTLDDFIEEETKLVKDAIAVLGSSDDKNCTYNLGYVKRQALYACMTCTPQNMPSSQPAGICLACSYHCHEGHDLIELYTKRLFRCDCGNSKFSGKKCNLEPNKADENEKNAYNQNFKGLYCTCARPYPDPDDDTPDDMIQCIICEDWYHTRHLNPELGEATLSNNYSEMICGSCTDRLTFLKHYIGLSVSPVSKNESADSSKVEINVETDGGVVNGLNSNDPPQESEESCILKKTKPLNETDSLSSGKLATFWPSNFRSSLCSCDNCKKMYLEFNIPWILDESDMVQAYEEEGIQKAENTVSAQAEVLLNNELAKFNRFQQVELIQNYNDFKSNLSEFLGKFVQEKKVVRKQDIDEFFEDMQAKKRRKIGTPPYNCH